MINSFSGDFRFLSNFFPCFVVLDGESYSSVEHAYQAAKTHNPKLRQQIRGALSPGQAKRLGRCIYPSELRPDWNTARLEIMYDLVKQKFARNAALTQMLHTTDGLDLIEGNHWGDTFWGVCNGKGDNHLGHILMRVRDEL